MPTRGATSPSNGFLDTSVRRGSFRSLAPTTSSRTSSSELSSGLPREKPMVSFLIRRAATLVVTLLVVSVLAFLIPYAGKGDTARKILRARVNDPALDPAQVEALTKELGLDRPLYQQYLDWLSHAVRGDFGFSYTSRTPVHDLVIPALGVSISLALAALLLAL